MLILDGKPIAVAGSERVVENIQFQPGMPNTRKQTGKWAGLGIHWTGGEAGAKGVVNTLKQRKLSVHFVCEPSGQLVQLADLSTITAHIGSPGNARFLGVETTCRGFATEQDFAEAVKRDPTLRARDALDWSTPRDTYRDTIAGLKVNFAGFNREQVVSLLWLANTTSLLFGFPRRIPSISVREADVTKWKSTCPLPNPDAFVVKTGDGTLWLPDFSRDPRVNPVSRVASWNGVLGHFHVHKNKCDPGTQILYALWADGWNPLGTKLQGATPI